MNTNLDDQDYEIKYEYNSRKKVLTRTLIEKGDVPLNPEVEGGTYEAKNQQSFKGEDNIKALYKQLQHQISQQEQARGNIKNRLEQVSEVPEEIEDFVEKLDQAGVEHKYGQAEQLQEQLEKVDQQHKQLMGQRNKFQAAVGDHIDLG